jgi:hypothetical protein
MGPQASDWEAETALEAGAGLGGCAVGDVMPDRPGQEIVAVGNDGSVHLMWPTETEWKSERLHMASGELIQVSIGEFDPTSPGPEIIGVGMASGQERRGNGKGVAVVIRRTPDGWRGDVVFTAPALQHSVCVSDAGTPS